MDITVTDISYVKVRVFNKEYGSGKLSLGREDLGFPYENVDYPKEVTVITFTTSLGESYTVASHPVPYSQGKQCLLHHSTSWVKVDKRFQRRVKLAGISLSFEAVAKLKKGMVIIHDQPVPPPRVRSGKTVTVRMACAKWRQKTGQCFEDPTMSFEAFGSNLLFTASYDDGDLYIVDSPLYGRGLYIFRDYQPAYDWATRRIDFRSARQIALAFVPHVGSWGDKVAAVL